MKYFLFTLLACTTAFAADGTVTLVALTPSHADITSRWVAEGLTVNKGKVVFSGAYNELYADGRGNGYSLITDGKRVYEFSSFRNRQVIFGLGEGSKAAFIRIGEDLVTLQGAGTNAQSAITKAGLQNVMDASERCAWDKLKGSSEHTFSTHFKSVNLALSCELRKDSLHVLHWKSMESPQ